MIKACLLVIAGGFMAQLCRVPISWDLCKLCLVASALLLVPRRSRSVAWLLLGFSLFVRAGLTIVEERIDPQFVGDSMLARVRVLDFPEVRGESVSMLVAPLNDRRLPPVSRVSWFEPPLIPSVGDTLELVLRLRQPRGTSNPAVFDYEAWLFRNRINATGYVVRSERNRPLPARETSPIDLVRLGFVENATAAAPDAVPVLAAVGVGARHLISDAQWRRYALTGTSHLMAISGLHVGLAATSSLLLFSALLGALRFRGNSCVAALCCSVLVAGLYALISGLGVPAQRAAAMVIFVAVAVTRRRQPDPLAALAVAGLIVFLGDPVATMTPGFGLSFMAVLLLLWLARRKNIRAIPVRRVSRVATAIKQLFTLQVFLLIGLMPLTVLNFQRVAIHTVTANLFAVPVFSVAVVPLTLAALVVSTISDAACQALLRLAGLVIGWIESLIGVLARLPYAEITVADIRGHMWPVVFVPLIWPLLPRGWPGRRLALLGVLAIVVHAPRAPPEDCIDLHVLDVGQGSAIVMQTAAHFLVFDTGMAFRNGGSVAEMVVTPFLRSLGASRIDWLIVSHSDIDHSGGVGTLMDNFETGEILTGEPVNAAPAAGRCRAGRAWRVDGLRFLVLHPDTPTEGNNSSCVLLVMMGRRALLLTGDIELQAEREILRRGQLPDVDIVIVPHHGSLTSSSRSFVEATAPELAIVSAGYDNRWGFPRPIVMGRWRSVGAEVLSTAEAGAVSVRLCAEGAVREVRRDRHERRRFWRAGAD